MEPLVLGAHENAGWVEVICGSMFSGKTEELIRRLRRAEIAGQRVESFAPALDTRPERPGTVVSHDETSLASTPVSAPAQVLLLASGADVVGIDEAQFFDPSLVEVCQTLARGGTRVVVAGLDQDFRGRPFEPVPQLMAVAEHVTKLHAICMKCGAPANHSQRLAAGSERVLVGAGEAYEPRCRRCFVPPGDAAAGPAAARPSAEREASATRGDENAASPAAPAQEREEAVPSERPKNGAGDAATRFPTGAASSAADATEKSLENSLENSLDEAPF